MAVTRGEEHGEVRTEDVGQIPDVVRQEEEFVEGGRVGGELPRPGGRGTGGVRGEEAGEGSVVVRVEASDFFGLGVGGV